MPLCIGLSFWMLIPANFLPDHMDKSRRRIQAQTSEESVHTEEERQEETSRHPDHEEQGDANPVPDGLGTDSRYNSR